MSDAAGIDQRLAEARELAESASIQLEEAVRALEQYRDALDLDPEQLQRVEARLASIHELARKHRVQPSDLPEFTTRLGEQLEASANVEAHRAELLAQRAVAEQAYLEAAGALSTARERAAQTLAKQVGGQLAELGMRGTRFEVAVRAEGEARYSAEGSSRSRSRRRESRATAACHGQGGPGGELARIGLRSRSSRRRRTSPPGVDGRQRHRGGVAEIAGGPRALGETGRCWPSRTRPRSRARRIDILVTKRAAGGFAHPPETLSGDAKVEERARMLGASITRRTWSMRGDDGARRAIDARGRCSTGNS